MDNLCHTLVGAAFGEAGLGDRTRFGRATLLIASNLPDVDVLAFATSTPAVALRRGWTHGVLGQVLLPALLTAVVVLVDRRWPRRGRSPDDPRQACSRPLAIYFLACLGTVTHVLMDLLNTYGVRLLMPFDRRWFYGDLLFIVDPWLWIALGIGVWLARQRQTPFPARVALGVAASYVFVIGISAHAASAEIADRWRQVEGRAPQALMVAPVPVTPLRRDVVIDAGDHYEQGEFRWRPRSVRFSPEVVPKNDRDPRVAIARSAPNIRAFLVWSRFPVWTLEPVDGGTRVTVSDMRFIDGRGLTGRTFSQSTIVDARGQLR